ncbi:MAG: hypothetical protein OCD02_17195 [Spirochaetaceae bacterium]
MELKNYYNNKLPLYESATITINELLKRIIAVNSLEVHDINGRAKSLKSFLTKAENYKNPKYEIKDYIGLRIIAYVQDDVTTICKLIEDEFDIDQNETSNKNEDLGINKIGYRSIHYICKINSNRCLLPEYSNFKNYVFEIQIRTLLQHTWAEIEHDKNYKFSGTLPTEIKRRFNLISAVLEVADNEFNNIAKDIEEYTIEIKEKFNNQKFDYEINSTTLLEYFNSSVYSAIIQKISPNEWRKNSTEIIDELNIFGIKNIKELSLIDNDKYLEYKKKIGENTNILGLIRDLLIIKDDKKYFDDCWKEKWSGINSTTYELYKEFDIPINKYIDEYELDILS